MIEIFSREPDVFTHTSLSHATKLTVEEEVSSLSALMLDKEYYQFVIEHTKMIDGLKIASDECLVILKIRAYNDLKAKTESGDTDVDSYDIKKHKNDVFRLAQNFSSSDEVACTEYMIKDIRTFVSNLDDDSVDLRSLDIDATKAEILSLISRVFVVQ